MARRPGGPGIGVTALVLTILLGGAVAGCSARSPETGGGAATLTILAAASLRDPLRAVAAEYEAAEGVRLVVATDSSTALRVQIEQGARADLFLSSDAANPEALAAAGLTDGGLVSFAGSPLAIVVPAGNPGGLATPADLARPGLAIVAAGDGVPVTAYAAQLLEQLAALPGYPDDFPSLYAANVVTREDNVRAALAKVELGEGDAAIVYASDAAGSDAVDTVPIPAATNVIATYVGAVLASARDRAAAHAFMDWLAGPDGTAILASFGFVGAP